MSHYDHSLPDKLSELIQVARNDLDWIKDKPKYSLDGDFWHKPKRDEQVCLVCLAGAVIARKLCNPELYILPMDFDNDTRKKLHVLNLVRTGRWSEIKNEYHLVELTREQKMTLESWSTYENRSTIPKLHDADKFLSWLDNKIVQLKEIGL